MTLTLELTSAQETQLREEAARTGLEPAALLLARAGLTENAAPNAHLHALLALPPQARDASLSLAAEHLAAVYEADLALPQRERELTAFEGLQEPLLSHYSVDGRHGT